MDLWVNGAGFVDVGLLHLYIHLRSAGGLTEAGWPKRVSLRYLAFGQLMSRARW